MAELYHTIYTHEDLTPDLLISIFFLKEYGDEKYPGIHQARVEVVESLPQEKDGSILEKEGSITFGFESALFTHMSNLSYTRQIIQALGIENHKAIEAFIHIAEKNSAQEYQDFYTILESVIEEYKEKSNKAYKASYPLIKAHFDSLQESLDPLATEYMRKLNNGDVFATIVMHHGKEVRLILIESNNPEMAQFLHNTEEIQADIVAQKFSSGHTNITTRHRSRVNLSETVAVLRIEEARKKKLPFDNINWNDLRNPDRMEHLEEWKFDEELRGIFNTKSLGKKHQGATMLSLKDLKHALIIGLDTTKLDRKCPPVGCRGKKCKFYFFNLDRCQNRRSNKDIDQKKEELKDNVQVLKKSSVAKLDDNL